MLWLLLRAPDCKLGGNQKTQYLLHETPPQIEKWAKFAKVSQRKTVENIIVYKQLFVGAGLYLLASHSIHGWANAISRGWAVPGSNAVTVTVLTANLLADIFFVCLLFWVAWAVHWSVAGGLVVQYVVMFFLIGRSFMGREQFIAWTLGLVALIPTGIYTFLQVS